MFIDYLHFFPELLIHVYCPLVGFVFVFVVVVFILAFSFQSFRRASSLWQLPCYLTKYSRLLSFVSCHRMESNISLKNSGCFNRKQYFKTTIIDIGLLFQNYNQSYSIERSYFIFFFFAFGSLINLEFILMQIHCDVQSNFIFLCIIIYPSFKVLFPSMIYDYR